MVLGSFSDVLGGQKWEPSVYQKVPELPSEAAAVQGLHRGGTCSAMSSQRHWGLGDCKPSKSTRKQLEGVGVNFRPSDSVQCPGFYVFIFLSTSLTELRIQMQGM